MIGKAYDRLPEGWRMGVDDGMWIIEIDQGRHEVDVVEVGRGATPGKAIAAALKATYECPRNRCIEPRPVDQTAPHTHRLRPKSAMELLWEDAYPDLGNLARGQTIHFSIFDSLEPESRQPVFCVDPLHAGQGAHQHLRKQD